METKTVKLYSLDYSNARTYLMAALFIAGNMALPQLFHLIPQGGITWLPIYFFTLIGAYKFGWKVGLLTAVLSPVINSLLFGMPLPAVLPAAAAQNRTRAAAAPAADPRTGSRAAAGTAVPGPDRNRNRQTAPFCWCCWRSWPWVC